MPDKEVSARRSESRFPIKETTGDRVSTTVITDQEACEHAAHLVDVSRNGVRIGVGCRLERGRALQIRICSQSLGLNVLWNATVRWVQPKDAETWWAGCELQDVVPADVIEKLARAGLLNRRRDPRNEINVAAKARCELSEVVMDVVVLNYSKGGFCMRSSARPTFPSEQVMLMFQGGESEIQVPARVMWDRQEKDCHLFGCSFATNDGFVLFREAIEPGWATQRPLQMLRHKPRVSTKMWFAIAAFVLVAVKGYEVWSGGGRRDEPSVLETVVEKIRSSLGDEEATESPESQDPT